MRAAVDLIVMAAAFVLCMVSCESHALEWPKDMPPPKLDPQTAEAAAIAIRDGYTPLECFQRRDRGITSVCISKTQWLRLQEQKNGTVNRHRD